MKQSTPGFPVVRWGDNLATFFSHEAPEDSKYYAVVVFTWTDKGWLVANIPNRGWCVPSGRIEAGETPIETAHREAFEEVGATLKQLKPVGHYRFMSDIGAETLMPTFVSLVEKVEPIPQGSESLGIRYLKPDELRENYWRWDELLESMFGYAQAIAESL
ncbi:MAG: NUDIX domain-containing protein [Chthonomonadales bacterium]